MKTLFMFSFFVKYELFRFKGDLQSSYWSSINLCGQPTDTLGPIKKDNASPSRITATAGTRFVGTDRRVYSLCFSPIGFIQN
jgi:hypothetical protein